MDPKATLKLIFAAMDRRDFDAVFEHARDLDQWLCRGGFYPVLDESEQRDLIANLVTACHNLRRS